MDGIRHPPPVGAVPLFPEIVTYNQLAAMFHDNYLVCSSISINIH